MIESPLESLAIVIPTYNEAYNVGEVLQRLSQSYPTALVYVVDDGSPDGTADVVRTFAQDRPNFHLIERPGKGGRGSAVVAGFAEALKRLETRYFLEMDADSSHDPDEIPRLIARIDEADVVVGSRYLAQSKIVGWPVNRHMFSRLANVYARILLGVPISDYTNGFRLYRRATLEQVGLAELRERGYIVLSETAYKLHNAGFTFADVPTTFVNRSIGKSNTTMREIMNSFAGIIRIRSAGPRSDARLTQRAR